MFKILCIFILLFFTGCSFLGIRTVEDRKQIAQEEVNEFSSLLKEGWEIRIQGGEVILVKDTENGLEIKEVFED